MNPSQALILRAAAFAAERHRHQRRLDAASTPYINHPLALADVLANEGGIDDPLVLCAALLHDTIEDTETTAAQIEAAFGAQIAAVVLEVSDDKSLSKHERKRLQIEHAAHASAPAQLIKLADKICNLRDLLQTPPKDWSAARKREYFEWSARVIAGVRGVHPGLEAVFDAVYAHVEELADSAA